MQQFLVLQDLCTTLQRKYDHLYVLCNTGNAYDVMSYRRLSPCPQYSGPQYSGQVYASVHTRTQ